MGNVSNECKGLPRPESGIATAVPRSTVDANWLQQRGAQMKDVTTVRIDLAKNVFSVHGVDARGSMVIRKAISRARLLPEIAQLPPCIIGLEACSGAHEWARRFRQLGHDARIMASKFVAAYRKGGKNDGNDAEAICEAVSRPSMRFVPVKTVEQQATLTLHRVRQGFIEERTATINRLRGLLAEFGIVLLQRAIEVRRGAGKHLDLLPATAARATRDLLEHVQALEARIVEYERELETHAHHDDRARRIQALHGVGPVSASAVVATVSDAREFASGRQFAAWLGLVPRQYSTAGLSSSARQSPWAASILGAVSRPREPHFWCEWPDARFQA